MYIFKIPKSILNIYGYGIIIETLLSVIFGTSSSYSILTSHAQLTFGVGQQLTI